jgi:hypothetical protein
LRLRRKTESGQGEKQDAENHFFTGNGASRKSGLCMRVSRLRLL